MHAAMIYVRYHPPIEKYALLQCIDIYDTYHYVLRRYPNPAIRSDVTQTRHVRNTECIIKRHKLEYHTGMCNMYPLLYLQEERALQEDIAFISAALYTAREYLPIL